MNELVDIVYLFPPFCVVVKSCDKNLYRERARTAKTAPIEIPAFLVRCPGPDLERHLP